MKNEAQRIKTKARASTKPIVTGVLLGACLMGPMTARAQSFQPGWTSWGGANLGASTLARQRAAIARRNGQLTPSSVSRGRPVRAYRTLTPPPPPGASYEERAAWARQEDDS